MRTTIIPAQITTVEDKIIGSLTMQQMIILLTPVFFGILVFVLFPPTMKIALYKIVPVLIVFILCLLLSLRIKGKVMISWLQVILQYNLRPTYYVYNKNDSYMRDVPDIHQEEKQIVTRKEEKKELKIKAQTFGLKELKQWESYIKNPNYSLSFKSGKKGELYVAIAEVQK